MKCHSNFVLFEIHFFYNVPFTEERKNERIILRMYLPWKARLCSIAESLSGFFLSFCSFVEVYHETGRWGTDPAPNPVRNWRKWHQPLPAVTCNLCSGLWHRAHIFLHLSLIGLKTRVSKCEDLGRQDRERREYPGWQSLALRRNLVPSCLLLS